MKKEQKMQDCNGNSALIYACENNYIDLIQLLMVEAKIFNN